MISLPTRGSCVKAEWLSKLLTLNANSWRVTWATQWMFNLHEGVVDPVSSPALRPGRLVNTHRPRVCRYVRRYSSPTAGRLSTELRKWPASRFLRHTLSQWVFLFSPLGETFAEEMQTAAGWHYCICLHIVYPCALGDFPSYHPLWCRDYLTEWTSLYAAGSLR